MTRMKDCLGRMRSDRDQDRVSREGGEEAFNEEMGLEETEAKAVHVHDRHRLGVGGPGFRCPAFWYVNEISNFALGVLRQMSFNNKQHARTILIPYEGYTAVCRTQLTKLAKA